jgi:alpha-beta hydrolase superfamily lysophospholipase
MIEEEITFKTSRGLRLSGALLAPDENEHDVIVFAHGTGSNISSPRNRGIAEKLLDEGIASLLFDFTGHGNSDGLPEQSTEDQQFDDLISALDFIDEQTYIKPRFVGINGSSTGGTVAIRAAAEDERIQVMVLRVPRRHDVLDVVPLVKAPTLIVQGSDDAIVLPDALAIYEALTCPKELRLIRGAGHLFDEKPEYTQEMIAATCDWFKEWFRRFALVE